RASVKIAGLNIKGRGNPNVLHDDNKWYHIWQLMREQKLGVLVIGEAHLDDSHKCDVDNLFGRAIRLEFTPDEEAPAARAGVAFALNKNLVETSQIKTTEVIAGRAMILEMKNMDGTPLIILGVYAPNRPHLNAEFWKKIKVWFVAHPNVRPTLLGGDTNLVEDAIDRLPSHEDNNSAVLAFQDLKSYLGLVDGWRETYPTTRAYTFTQPIALGGSQSRIDRFYVKEDVFEHTFEWDIQTVGIETDHRMISLRLTTEKAPTIGHGRWVWPAHLIRDKEITKFLNEEGLKLEAELDALEEEEARGQWNPSRNAQTLWANWKNKSGKKVRDRSRIVVPKLTEEIAEIKNKMDIIANDKELTEEEKTLSGAVLQEKLSKLEKQRHNGSRLSAQVRNRLEGEVISSYWTQINKPHKPRDIIARLRNSASTEDIPRYETNSKNMADMARNYHNSLQNDQTPVPRPVRGAKITTVLERTTRRTTEEQQALLRKRLTLEDVRDALRKSANFKAPGLNGITYEVWKILDQRYESAKANDKRAFNILRVLLRVYNDIEKYGVVKGTKFAESWMCPLYKKNDKADIANYRPISLLNTDYKIFTKALTIKL
ncbi:Endonuclease/exonuclease/phosphatase, partial [Favolaschia claudopus]